MSQTMLLRVPPGTVLQNAQITNTRYGTGGATPADQALHPHLVDAYVPSGFVKLALVLLHGAGGRKGHFAANLGLLFGPLSGGPSAVNWNLLSYYGMAVFIPQGQYCHGVDAAWGAGGNPYNPNDVTTISANNPQGVPTWDNRVMLSRYDDRQFLLDLAAWIQSQVGVTGRILAGHSNGGMMANRMWYEHQPYSYHAYASASGPPSVYYRDVAPSPPAVVVPLFEQHAAMDTNIGIAGGHFQDATWTLSQASVAYPVFPAHATVIGAWQQFQRRIDAFDAYSALPPETPSYGGGVVTNVAIGTRTDWSAGNGGQRLRLYSDAAHGITTQQKANARKWVSDVAAWGYTLF